MSIDKTELTNTLRAAFASFWEEQLQVEAVAGGLAVSPPLLYADGWQVTIYLEQLTPKQWRITDRGATLGKLLDAGLQPDQGKLATLIQRQTSFYGFDRDGLQFEKLVRFPFEVAEIQIFAEGLIALSHQMPKVPKEIIPGTEHMIEDRIASFFYNRRLTPLRRHKLAGQVEREITVDFYLEGPQPLALQPVTRARNLRPYMEQWGWRWTDLKNRHPDMIRAMIYDPDNQPWDEASLNIGREVCTIFAPYHETDAALSAALTA
ncbi:MAG: DUF1828 domain-containing protein [Opitutales bacterium]|nr:DUF1828 domain-containing protein [Opitutales bacterium]